MALYWQMHFIRHPRELIQSSAYEKVIHQIMNDSMRIFPDKYHHVQNQSHGEPDFISISGNKKKFDAKLLFSNEQCQLLSKGKNELIAWIMSVHQEINEASQKLLHNQLQNIHETTLYNELLSRLPSEEIQEDTIYFTPYPIAPTYEESIFSQFAVDILSATFQALTENHPEKFFNKECYIIYPTIPTNKLVLRNLNRDSKEYCSAAPLSPYVTYSCKSYPDTDADYIFYS